MSHETFVSLSILKYFVKSRHTFYFCIPHLQEITTASTNMVRKKRAAPPPPNLIDTHRPALPSPPSSLLCEPQEENQNKQQGHQQTADFCKQMSVNFTEKLSDDPFYLFGQTDEDDRCLSNSSPSQDSGVPSDSELSNLTSNRDEKSRSRDSSVSKR